jgi:hypothetical protein
MARNTLDEQHEELTKILNELLDDDQNITAREVARRHSTLSSASTVTRHPMRRQILETYQQRQIELRLWESRVGKNSQLKMTTKLATQQVQIVALENTVNILTAGHVTLIAAVAQLGGMGKLAKFYEDFREIRNGLFESGALPHDSNI